ncbi:MAG: hypothetical protein K1W16_04240 [Lachnospiraceae bacterium]|jgi:hypothetical protein
MSQEMLQKAVLTIDCAKKGKNTVSNVTDNQKKSCNQSAKRALEQGGNNIAAQKELHNGAEITVQYNPATIKYRASVTENNNIKYENQGDKSYQIASATGENSVEMSFTLVFHSRFSGDTSVQEQMECIFEMIRQSPTRHVEFQWAKIHMEGRLVSFSGEYDMFDTAGIPISGHMDMTIENATKVEKTNKL